MNNNPVRRRPVRLFGTGIGAVAVLLLTWMLAVPQSGTAPHAVPVAHAQARPTQTHDEGPDVDRGEARDAAAQNIVQIDNQKDDRLRVRGSIQLNHIPGNDVEPLNEAVAYSDSCNDCATFAVALQIDLVNPNATNVQPQNYAIAVNYRCNGCHTAAWAFQYVVPVYDTDQVPDDVGRLLDRMERELRAVAHDHGETVDDAETRIQAVVDQFSKLANSLYDQRDEHVSPAAAPADTGTPTATATYTPASTAIPAATPSPSGTPTANDMSSATDTPTVTPTPTPTPTPTATPSPSPSPTPSPSPSPTPTATPAGGSG